MEKFQTALNNEEEYNIALKRTIEIFHADENTEEGKELRLLLPLVIDYENRHFHIPSPKPSSENNKTKQAYARTIK